MLRRDPAREMFAKVAAVRRHLLTVVATLPFLILPASGFSSLPEAAPPPVAPPSETARLLAEADAQRRAAHPFDALRLYYVVLDREPANAAARTGAAAILRELRAPFAAARLTPGSLPDADMAAAEVRWGTQANDEDPAHRFDATDRAIADLERLIRDADSQGDADLARRLRMDRIVALRDRARMAEVIAEADALKAGGQPLPPYVREALADALLYQRQPKAARAEYDAVLRDDPDNRDAKIGQIYAALEMEDFASAYALSDALLANEPVWLGFAGDPGRTPNENYLGALLRAIGMRSFGDEQTEAWARIAPERDAAPRNPFVRVQAASIMQGRDWPRAAEQEYRIALGMAPSLLGARTGVADVELGRNEIDQAREDIAVLAAQYPESTTVQTLQSELSAATGWQVEAEINPAHETGGGEFGNAGNELDASLTVHSPLIDDQWRLFGAYAFDNSHPAEGYVDLKRYTAGGQLILPDFTGSLAVTENVTKLSRTGFAGTADWAPSDQLSFALAGEVVSSETPLRAFLHGISADLASSRFTYVWDETHQASIGLSWMPFTDGNQRVSLAASYGQKLVESPHFGLTVEGELYGSTNSIKDAPYYNPAADGSAAITLLAEHTLWRRYETSWVQAVTLNGGWYGQRDFPGGPIGTVTYEQRWRFDPRTELVYGASIGERLYDGEYAREIGGFITLREKL
jgi:biofilm PGA synthesis protein PgaA